MFTSANTRARMLLCRKYTYSNTRYRVSQSNNEHWHHVCNARWCIMHRVKYHEIDDLVSCGLADSIAKLCEYVSNSVLSNYTCTETDRYILKVNMIKSGIQGITWFTITLKIVFGFRNEEIYISIYILFYYR